MTEELATYGGPEGENRGLGSFRTRIGKPIRYAGTGVQVFVVAYTVPGTPDLFEVWVETDDEVPTICRRHWQSESDLAVLASAKLLAAKLNEVAMTTGLSGRALLDRLQIGEDAL